MLALRASTWKKGLVSSICVHAELFHFHGILYSSVSFLYISGVFYVMNIGWSQSMVSIITMVSSIAFVMLVEVKILFSKFSPFPSLD